MIRFVKPFLFAVLFLSGSVFAQVQFFANQHADGWRYTKDPLAQYPLVNLNSSNTLSLGGNLSELASFDTSWPFSDLMKAAYGWRSVSGTGAFTIDVNDRITQLDGDRVLGTYLTADLQDPTVMTAGEYTVRKTGTGEYNVGGTGWTSAATSTFNATQGQFLEMQVRGGTITSLMVARTSDLAAIDAGNPWRPEFLAYLEDLNPSTLRYLNWSVANKNYNHLWSQRTTVDSISYAGGRSRSGGLDAGDDFALMKAIPWELIIDLSNRLKSNAWINIPARYDDAAITSLATLIRDTLDPNLKVKIEIANETWNAQFPASLNWMGTENTGRYLLSGSAGSNVVTISGGSVIEGESIRLLQHELNEIRPVFGDTFYENLNVFTLDNVSGNTAELNFNGSPANLTVDTPQFYFYKTSEAINGNITQNIDDVDFGTASRSVEMYNIFDSVFGANSSRVEKIIASQADYIERTRNRIGASGTNGLHDIVSIGGYFGAAYTYTSGDTLQDVIDFFNAPASTEGSLLNSFSLIDDVIALDSDPLYEVKRIQIYEGGDHSLGLVGAATDLLNTVAASPEMGVMFETMLDHYATLPQVEEFNVYRLDVGAWNQFGRWALKANYGATTAKHTLFSNYKGNVLRVAAPLPQPDTTAPVLSLIGTTPIEVTQGGTYTDQGAAFNDNVDSYRVVAATGTVDANTVGSYTLTYSTTDTAGNASNTITRTVNVVAASSGLTPVNSSYFHVLGHSLFSHWAQETSTDYTTAGEWLGVLANSSGTSSTGAQLFGFIAEHNARDWSSAGNIGYNFEFGINNTLDFDPEFNDLANDPVDTFYFMASNFDGADMGQFPFDSTTATFVSEANALYDNINGLFPSAEKILYIHEPEGGPLGGYNMTRAQFTAYNNATMNEYLDWHIEAQDAIIASGRNIKSVPVGPVLAWLFENESYLSSLEFNEIYLDPDPHGTESLYLLKAIVVYMAKYQQDPVVAGLTIPAGATVLPEVANNLPAIVNAIRTRLAFHNSNGVNVY